MQEIDSIVDFKVWILNPESPAAIQALDLQSSEDQILMHQFPGSLFLGCLLSNDAAGHIVKTGGTVISNRDQFKFKVHKSHLYSVDELFEGFDPADKNGYLNTYDYQIYKEYLATGMETPPSIEVSLARRLHDHSITDALLETLEGKKVVAVMGGHSMERQDPFYLKVAKISRKLTLLGFLMVSGGGPGAMEATHLGAYFAHYSEEDLINAIEDIKVREPGAPAGREYEDGDWLIRAWKVLIKYPIPKERTDDYKSIGIPTWLYGHEPPAPFATQIAKYFANSVREDGLLTIAKHGIIFAPGSAGTTQEIFQDAAQNHYAPYNNQPIKKYVSPMILFGIKRWTEDRPVWDLLKKVSENRPYGDLIALTEDETKVIDLIKSYDPENYQFP